MSEPSRLLQQPDSAAFVHRPPLAHGQQQHTLANCPLNVTVVLFPAQVCVGQGDTRCRGSSLAGGMGVRVIRPDHKETTTLPLSAGNNGAL